AFYHVGFTRYVRDDRTGALDAWQTGLASGPPPALQAQLLYWTARATPSSSPGAQLDAFNQAAMVAPETYYGLRAQEQLSGTLSVASSTTTASTVSLVPSPSELQERAAWLAELKTTPERVAQQIEALPALQRADVLLDLGLRTEASWEIDGVA